MAKTVTPKRRLLWIGDSVAHTGFSTVTHSVLDQLYKTWDVSVLGINYHGDPHKYPYPIWPASRGQDLYGINRLPGLLQHVKPDVVCILNDPWVVQNYMPVLLEYNERVAPKINAPSVKIAVYTPVDGLNIGADFVASLNGAHHVVAYNEFGLRELQKAGLVAPSSWIAHGVDRKVFYPVNKVEARKRLGLNPDWYIVGCVARNQPRKRLDLLFQYFAEWAYDKPDNVKLYYHGALSDQGWDIANMAEFFGIDHRLIITSKNITPSSGVSKEVLRDVMNSFDLHALTTLGEGFGLPVAESMACGVPNLVPEWSALGDWARGAVAYAPCTAISMHPGGLNTVGGVADRGVFVHQLQHFYENAETRKTVGKAGLELVSKPEFSWTFIAKQFDAVFKGCLNG